MKIAVRLEGGLGDHILGMRLLKFIQRRYPHAKIIVYSDSNGAESQTNIAKLSPYVADVIPVYRDAKRLTHDRMWQLDNILPHDLSIMRQADLFFDAAIWTYFIPQATLLDVPFYSILASRPALRLSQVERDKALRTLGGTGRKYVAMNLSKYGEPFLRLHHQKLRELLLTLLRDPRVHILNIFRTSADFEHWPEPQRTQRRRVAAVEKGFLEEICTWDKRILAITDRPIESVATMMSISQYYIGVDNGLKHLAWALGIPHTLILARRPAFDSGNIADFSFVLHWMPDFHRGMCLNNESEFHNHLEVAMKYLNCRRRSEWQHETP